MVTTATAGTGPLRAAAANLTALSGAARSGALDAAAALRALTAIRHLAAAIELTELACSEAARDGGATWAQVAAAMGARGRSGAQKRHADLSRRYPPPPMIDTAQELPGVEAVASRLGQETSASARSPAPHAAAGRAPTRARRAPGAPKITARVIAEGQYELVRATDYTESRAWLVMVGGKCAGLVRPTWRGENRRAAWEPVHPSGTVLPPTGTGRVTGAGNCRTRDAAAISLLNVLLREQEQR